jgi:hypothetical protein
MPGRVKDGVDQAGRLHALVRHGETADAVKFAMLPKQGGGACSRWRWVTQLAVDCIEVRL